MSYDELVQHFTIITTLVLNKSINSPFNKILQSVSMQFGGEGTGKVKIGDIIEKAMPDVSKDSKEFMNKLVAGIDKAVSQQNYRFKRPRPKSEA